jgi:choline dehydrogenase-like flavoprotein
MAEGYDFIIIGGGSAGSVLAARLTENPTVRVCLLEAGGRDWNPLFHLPAGFAKMTKGVASWGWSTVPQRHMGGKVFTYTQAKVIGGGSAINAQIYTRGNAQDYDEWRQMGCEGWSYDDVLPVFPQVRGQRHLRQRIPRQGRSPGRVAARSTAADLRGLFRGGRGAWASRATWTSTAKHRTARPITS